MNKRTDHTGHPEMFRELVTLVSTWTIDVPGGLEVKVVPLPIEGAPDRVSFGWLTSGVSIPGHQDRVQRPLAGPAVPKRYFWDPCPASGGRLGWITDEACELDPVGQSALAFVASMPESVLLEMCRAEARRRVERATRDRGGSFDTTAEPSATDCLHIWLLWAAALDQDDPEVRRVALQLAQRWHGGPADMMTAAGEVLR